MTDFRFMKSMRSSLGLGMVWAVLACVPAWGQHDPPSRKAQKAYADALEAYRFLSFNLAVSHLDKAIEKSPSFAEAWFLKAQIYQEMDHPEEEAVLAKALAIDASLFPHGWVTLAQIQWELGKVDEGLESLARLDALGPAQLPEETVRRRAWVQAGLEFVQASLASETPVEEATAVPGG